VGTFFEVRPSQIGGTFKDKYAVELTTYSVNCIVIRICVNKSGLICVLKKQVATVRSCVQSYSGKYSSELLRIKGD